MLMLRPYKHILVIALNFWRHYFWALVWLFITTFINFTALVLCGMFADAAVSVLS